MGFTCNICKDEGYLFKSGGIKVTCSCKLRKDLGIKDEIQSQAPVYTVDKLSAESCTSKGLVPQSRINDTFDIAKIKANITKMYQRSPFVLYKFQDYCNILGKINVSISTRTPLGASYIIGAPNGFGKTSFVNSCIMLMDKQDMKCAPYISLMEIAALRYKEQKKLLGARFFSKDELDALKIADREPTDFGARNYSFTDYVNSDILFTYMSSLDCAELESKMLKDIVIMRDTKGLPTIVFMSTSMQRYVQSEKLNDYVWKEILAYKEDYVGYDRIIHISTYIRGNPKAAAIDAQLKEQTGG